MTAAKKTSPAGKTSQSTGTTSSARSGSASRDRKGTGRAANAAADAITPLPKARVAGTGLGSNDAGALVIGVLAAEGEAAQEERQPQLAAGAEPVAEAFPGDLLATLRGLGATGTPEQVISLPAPEGWKADLLMTVGVGTPQHHGSASGPVVEAEQVRRAAGAAGRALAGTAGVDSATMALSEINFEAAVEGILLGSYGFTSFRSTESTRGLRTVSATTGTLSSRAAKAAMTHANAVSQAIYTARDLVNTPPNHLFPQAFAERASALAEAAGMQVEVLDEKALRLGGYGGVLGVGEGSSRPPRLVRLHWDGAPSAKKSSRANSASAAATSVPSVALVGKGVTFDTGGISIKPAASMANMTSDMGGAAAMIATAVLAATLELPLQLTATIPIAENMPSATAYRPGDVLSMYNGTTVEVLNTDAEGRLILADALARACEDEPDYLLEAATLTGAQTVALGNRTPGIMGSAGLRDLVAEHAQASGEGGWAMPLPDHIRAELDSKVADIANVTEQRTAGMLVAGVFLSEFVSDGTEWAHIDIAGPAYNTGSVHGYTPKGATGVPVRTVLSVLEQLAGR